MVVTSIVSSPREAPRGLGTRQLGILFISLPLLLSGCVKSGTYHDALGQLTSAQSREEALRERMDEEAARRDEREQRLQDQIQELNREVDRRIEEVGEAERETLRVQEELTERELEIQRLRGSLSTTGAQAQQLQARLDQLAAIEEEIRDTNSIYEEVLRRFRSQIDAGRLSVSIAQGRLVINLPQDILFASGSATLGGEGRSTVAAVAEVLSGIDGRNFQVEGHTDDDAISTAEFPSNWELSAGRALSVVKLLVDNGVAPETLSGAGYGEFDPVADNESSRGKRLNRRIEIVMLPNLNVIGDASR